MPDRELRRSKVENALAAFHELIATGISSRTS